jgi:RloB-like protein
VCDVDEFDVRTAIVEAAAHDDVELALSQPCFEVWLILHLKSGCPGFNDATQAGAHLKKVLPHWDKTALRFSDFSGRRVLEAVDHAKGLGEPPDANPSTAVWRVIESLRTPRDLSNDGQQ